MKKQNFIYSISAIILIIIIVLSINQGKSRRYIKKIDPAFMQYITAFTTGVISSESTIKIVLANEFGDSLAREKVLKKKLFNFSPSITGKTHWLDNRTIEFIPDKPLPHSEFFEAKFYLHELYQVPNNLKVFTFPFEIKKQDFDVQIENVKPYVTKNENGEYLFDKACLIGTVYTNDVISNEEIEKIIKVTQDKRELKLRWQHHENRKIHTFYADTVIRTNKTSEVICSWDGKPINVEKKGNKNISVPPKNLFTFLNYKTGFDSEHYLLLQFSDLLSIEQDFDGLINISNGDITNYFVDGNEIRVYYTSESDNNVIHISKNIKNSNNQKLNEELTIEAKLQDLRPAIKINSKGTILPTLNKGCLTFEAVNLKAVDVKIIKIFENNIPQFLQINSLSGSYELARVGKTIVKKTISLENSNVNNLKEWNKFSLDLSELINAEPGAIYRVSLSFKKEYSLIDCDGKRDFETDDKELYNYWTMEDIDEDNYYYYYETEEDYDYTYEYNSTNPCNSGYYYGKVVSRNIISSDIALIAKSGQDGSLIIFANNILTSQPIYNANIKVYNYQLQVIASGETDVNGEVKFILKDENPFLVVAQRNEQKGYLKLENENAIHLSKFDVGGVSSEKGIKGFIYTERGVWRPGDTIYLSFILQDKDKKLPPNHPITLELINPKNQLVKQISNTNPTGNIYQFNIPIDDNAPTGLWIANVKVGNITFSKNLRIETIIPNRIKINLDFGENFLFKGNPKKGKLEARWLHGAVARNLNAQINVTLTTLPLSFKKFSDYSFNDQTKFFTSETFTLFDGKLNENGIAEINSDFKLSDEIPGLLKAHIETRIYEPGGRFSIDRFSIPYYAYTSYIGIKQPSDPLNNVYETDKEHTLNIVLVDRNGNLLPNNRKALITVYKVNWDWWFDYTNNNQGNFIDVSYKTPIETKQIDIFNGQGIYKIKIEKPEWGLFLIQAKDLTSGHSATTLMRFEWPGFTHKQLADKYSEKMLSISSDKESYKIGEEITISFPSSKNKQALVTIENGTKVLNAKWIITQDEKTEYKFTATADMMPNIYVFVSYIQSYEQNENDMPLRLFGVIPIKIEDENTILKPQILCNDVFRPQSKASITVKEEKGRPMQYTLAIVDEGLLDLTRFKTPDPWNYFYAKEALGVTTYDIYDEIIGNNGSQMQRILAIGGGDFEQESMEKAKANRFKPLIIFLGPFDLKKGETKTHIFSIPQYIGSARIMLIASNQNFAYGFAEKTVRISKPLMLLATLPRVLTINETVQVPVIIFSNDNKPKKAEVTIKTNNMFTVINSNKQTVELSGKEEKNIYFTLKVNEYPGIGKINVSSSSGNETASHEIEIQIIPHNPPITEVHEAILRPGKIEIIEYNPIGLKGTNNVVLEISSIPSLNLEKNLRYLLEYPHGCLEQITSSAFPQLYLTDLMEITEKTKQSIERNIKSAINKIHSLQLPSGGLTYWPGLNYPDDWVTNYAGHFMLEAQSKGYTLPLGFLKKWIKYQKNKANNWHKNKNYKWNDDLIQAYRLYTLALAKEPAISAMNKMKEMKNISIQAQWRLAAAYAIAGKTEIAKQIIDNLNLKTEINYYRELSNTYGSTERDLAMILETMNILNMDKEAINLTNKIVNLLNSSQWYSTQTIGYCLLAISKFTTKSKLGGKNIMFEYSINNQKPIFIKTNKTFFQVELDKNLTEKKFNIKFESKSNTILYAKIISRGVPSIDKKVDSQNNLYLSVNYKDLNGNKINPEQIEQGTDFIAEVIVTNPGKKGIYKELALTQIFPSGWEIVTSRLSETYSENTNSLYNYQDIRDDRVITYFDLNPNSTKKFTIRLNAAYKGKFYLPAQYCEAMYDNTINARISGKWVEVVEPKRRLTSL